MTWPQGWHTAQVNESFLFDRVVAERAEDDCLVVVCFRSAYGRNAATACPLGRKCIDNTGPDYCTHRQAQTNYDVETKSQADVLIQIFVLQIGYICNYSRS